VPSHPAPPRDPAARCRASSSRRRNDAGPLAAPRSVRTEGSPTRPDEKRDAVRSGERRPAVVGLLREGSSRGTRGPRPLRSPEAACQPPRGARLGMSRAAVPRARRWLVARPLEPSRPRRSRGVPPPDREKRSSSARIVHRALQMTSPSAHGVPSPHGLPETEKERPSPAGRFGATPSSPGKVARSYAKRVQRRSPVGGGTAIGGARAESPAAANGVARTGREVEQGYSLSRDGFPSDPAEAAPTKDDRLSDRGGRAGSRFRSRPTTAGPTALSSPRVRPEPVDLEVARGAGFFRA
jgi:hypothetical protein